MKRFQHFRDMIESMSAPLHEATPKKRPRVDTESMVQFAQKYGGRHTGKGTGSGARLPGGYAVNMSGLRVKWETGADGKITAVTVGESGEEVSETPLDKTELRKLARLLNDLARKI